MACRAPRVPAVLVALLLFVAIGGALPAGASGAGSGIVIGQVYGGGGGAADAIYDHDFVQVFNRGASSVALTGWALQYASASGTSWQASPLPSVSIGPGRSLLVELGPTGPGGVALNPAPDASGFCAISNTSGKLALTSSTAALSGACPTADPSLADLVGYGAADCFEGAGAAGTLSVTTAAQRFGDGCRDTDVNAADFDVLPPEPRSSTSPLVSCAAGAVPPGAYDARIAETAFSAGGVSGGSTGAGLATRITVEAGATTVPLPAPSGTLAGAATAVSGTGFSGTITPTLSFVGTPTATLTPSDGSATGSASGWLSLAFSGEIASIPTSFTCELGSALSPVALAPTTAAGAPFRPLTGRVTLAQNGIARPSLTGGSSCAVLDLALGPTLSFSLTYQLTAVGTGPGAPGPPPPGGEPYVPAQAAINPSRRTLSVRDDVLLDASGSLPAGASAREFAWQLDRDPEPEITCGPETPMLQVAFRAAGTVTPQLTVTDSAGATTRTSTSLSVTRLGVRASGRGARAAQFRSTTATRIGTSVARAPSMPACVPRDRNSSLSIDVTQFGGPPPGCVDKIEARSALVSAVGCLNRTTWDKIPAAERELLTGELVTAWQGGTVPVASSAQGVSGPRGASPTTVVRDLVSDTIWVSDPGTPVRINGLDYTPAPGGVVVIVEPGLLSKSTPWVLSSRVRVTAPTSVGTIELRPRGPLALPAAKSGFRIASIPVRTGVPFIPGTRLMGTVDTTLEQDRSRLRTRLRLPTDFEWATGAPVTAEAQMIASNRDGVQLDGFGIENVDAEILGVGVRIDYLRYVASLGRFEGKAKVSFQPLGAIDAALHVRGPKIELLDITYTPGAPGIKVAPGVFLSQVRGFYENSPQVLRFGGAAAFTGGPSAGQGCGLVTARGGFEFRIDPAPITVTVDGVGSLVCIPLLHARARIAADGYVDVDADIDYDFGPLKLQAGWDIRYYDERFTAEAQARGCVGDLGCATGTAVVSDRGLAFCAEFGPVDAGAGLDWPPGPSLPAIISRLEIMFSGCDVGPWRSVVARPAQAGGPRRVRVGADGAVLGIVGGERAPRVRLRGPGGRQLDLPEQGPLRGEKATIFRVAERRTTFAVLTEPGDWTVEALDGTTITQVRQAPVLPDPGVRASIAGSGERRALRYAITPLDGQRVRFFERAGDRLRLIGEGHGREGTIRFAPLDGPARARSIVAAIEQDGRPREQWTVARFTSIAPRVGRVTRVRATRIGSTLRISFAPAPGATTHLVGVLLGDGRSLQLRAAAGRRTVRIRRVSAGTTVDLRIAGVRGQRRGPIVRAAARVH